jgi:S1-C subfamily serine protease
MENLNKNQLILLVLLVTFVTSIATGIMTVSLLQQAPVEVTRTIDNVVEKTIQQVTPAVVSNIIAPQTQSNQVTTVVVNEDDMVTSSIGKNLKSIVRIDETDLNGYVSFYGLGVVMTKDGIIATDSGNIASDSVYTAKFFDGAEWKLVPLGLDLNTNSQFFKVNLPATTTYAFSPAVVSPADLQLGQTVIGLGGETTNSVAVGRVVSLNMKDSTIGTTTTKYVSAIETDTSFKNILDGSPFFDLSGDLVGLKLSVTDNGVFTPITTISKELNAVSK